MTQQITTTSKLNIMKKLILSENAKTALFFGIILIAIVAIRLLTPQVYR